MLPACLTLILLGGGAGVSHAVAQDRYRVAVQENFRREPRPNGRLLARVNPGTEVRGGEARSGWIEITLEGWIWAPSLRPVNSDDFDHEVSARGGENLRAVANGTVVARLDQGFWVEEIDRDGDWVNVRRTGWMWGRSLERVDAVGAAPPPVADTPPAPNGESVPVPQTYSVTSRDAALRGAPDGDTSAMLGTGTALRVLERSGDWVRVQTEGWVKEDELRPGEGGILVGVRRADVRGRPEEFEGQLIEWRIQYVSLEVSNGLRRELPEGQPYMLATGPHPDLGFVYLTLTAEQADEVERLAPLAQLVVVMEVTAGRSRFLGNPVGRLVSMSVREP